MPRKPCDSVQEFRITLGDFERKKVQEIIKTQQANVAIDGATAVAQAAGTAIGGLGVWALGAAALLWVGFNFDDFIDNTSTRLAGWVEKTGFVNYHADEYGRAYAKVVTELDSLHQEAQALDSSNPADRKRHQAIMTRVALLTKRQEALEAIIHAIAEGDEVGFNIFGDDAGQLDTRYIDWYTRTHGHPPDDVPEWDIR